MLVAERVEAIYLECLYRYGDKTRTILTVISPLDLHVLLHPERVLSHKAEIEAMLEMLPAEFYRENGYGAPITNAVRTRHGQPWTINMDTVNMVFVLGVAIDRVCLFWPSDDSDVWAQIL